MARLYDLPVSPTTEKQYSRIAARFRRWIEAEGKEESPLTFQEALNALGGRLTLKSWRLYRNAITWYLRTAHSPQAALAFLAACEALERPPQKRRRLKKRVAGDALAAILDALDMENSLSARRVSALLIATVATGLRPGEWKTASLRLRQPAADEQDWRRALCSDLVLTVQNSKYRPPAPGVPPRGNGPERELILAKAVVNSPTETAIRDTIEWLHGKPWDKVGPYARQVFKAAVASAISAKKLPESYRSLRIYDCRHQFSADAKAAMDTHSGEVAASMGHISIETAVHHYGRRRFASGRASVWPSQKSVAAVSGKSIEKAAPKLGRKPAKFAPAPQSRHGPSD